MGLPDITVISVGVVVIIIALIYWELKFNLKSDS
jgi:hypothetical protein